MCMGKKIKGIGGGSMGKKMKFCLYFYMLFPSSSSFRKCIICGVNSGPFQNYDHLKITKLAILGWFWLKNWTLYPIFLTGITLITSKLYHSQENSPWHTRFKDIWGFKWLLEFSISQNDQFLAKIGTFLVFWKVF